MDYAQGWYEGDVARMRRCLHPELMKRRIIRDPETGEERLRQVSQELLVDLTRQGGGSETPVGKRYYDVVDPGCCRRDRQRPGGFIPLCGLPAPGALRRQVADRERAVSGDTV